MVGWAPITLDLCAAKIFSWIISLDVTIIWVDIFLYPTTSEQKLNHFCLTLLSWKVCTQQPWYNFLSLKKTSNSHILAKNHFRSKPSSTKTSLWLSFSIEGLFLLNSSAQIISPEFLLSGLFLLNSSAQIRIFHLSLDFLEIAKISDLTIR